MNEDHDLRWRARIVLLQTLAGVLALVALTLLVRKLTHQATWISAAG